MVTLFVLLALSLCFVYVFVRGVVNIAKVTRRKRWLLTKGKILASKLYDTSVNVSTLSAIKPMATQQKKSGDTYIEYQYEVDGQLYTSSNFYSAALSKLKINDILIFTEGSNQNVWYNPKDPREAYLKASSIFLFNWVRHIRRSWQHFFWIFDFCCRNNQLNKSKRSN